MFRTVSILVAVLAQAASALTPACLVRCVGPGGHACIEVAGRDCHCHVAATDHDHDTASGCHHHNAPCSSKQSSTDADSQRNGEALTWNNPVDGCDCEHSPLTSAASDVSKSRSRLIAEDTSAVALPVWSSASGAFVVAGQGIATTPFRPHSDAVALSLATVVLRV